MEFKWGERANMSEDGKVKNAEALVDKAVAGDPTAIGVVIDPKQSFYENPKFPESTYVSSAPAIIADVDGKLWHVCPGDGTVCPAAVLVRGIDVSGR